MKRHDELKRSLLGAQWGLVATAVMTIFMAIGQALFGSRLGRPFPLLLMSRLLPHAEPGRLAAATIVAHAGYGALAGIAFAYLSRPMTLGKGIGYALFLWFTMQITFVPWLGWGDFGLIHSYRFALYTLMLHLPYGVALGWLGARDEALHHASFDDFNGQLTARSA
jgi:hypothetical protein